MMMMIWYDIVSLSHVLNYFLKYLLYLVHDFVIFYLSNWLIFSVEYSLHLLSPKQLSLSAENALTTVCQTRWQILSGKEGGLAAAPPYEPTPTPSRLSPLGLDCRPYMPRGRCWPSKNYCRPTFQNVSTLLESCAKVASDTLRDIFQHAPVIKAPPTARASSMWLTMQQRLCWQKKWWPHNGVYLRHGPHGPYPTFWVGPICT